MADSAQIQVHRGVAEVYLDLDEGYLFELGLGVLELKLHKEESKYTEA